VQFHNISGEIDRGVDLFRFRIDEHADANASGMQPLHGRCELARVRDQIEAAFRRDLFAFLRDETDFVGHDAQRDIDNFRSIAHLEIQFRNYVCAQPFDIAVLNVSSVRAQMGGNAVCSGPFANAGDRHWIGLGIFRVRHGGIAHLPHGCDVIDVNSETQIAHCGGMRASAGSGASRKARVGA